MTLALTFVALWFVGLIVAAAMLSSDAFMNWLERAVDIKPEEW